MQKVVLVLFDLSESTNKPAVRGTYSQNFREVLSCLTHGDAILAGWITERSGAELRLPVKEDFPAFEPGTDNPLLVAALRAKQDSLLAASLDSVHATISNTLLSPPRRVQNTAVMSSLELAERIFSTYEQPVKVLVIMSDMLEDSDRYDFDHESLTQSRIEEVIREEREEERLPNLMGVRVYVTGSSGRGDIRRFWLSYFKASGAKLEEKDYGGPLIRIEECGESS